jgi:lipopolysaccharide assembly outer membrane protein LptD (OstA)
MIRFLAAFFVAVALLGSLAPAATPLPSARPAATPLPSARPAVSNRPAPANRPSASKANSMQGSSPASFDLGVWTVRASSLDANFKTGDFSTPDRIVMTRSGGDVTADRANGNYRKQTLYLNGHVVMHDSQGGATGLEESGASQQASPSTLTADKAEIDGAAKLYKAIGNVRYIQAETVVTANTGTLDDEAHTLLLEGAVHVTSGTRNMTASRVLYNTQTGNAHAQGDVTMQFPGQFHRKLATPKPLHVPKNALTQPVSPSSSPP